MKIKIVYFLMLSFIVACAPFSKEKYLERYEKFMDEVTQNYSSYNEDQRKEAQKEYDKFNEEWYNKFKDDLSFDEKLKLTGYTIRFNLMKAGAEVGKLYDSYLKSDIDELKKRIDYYVKNDMEKDLNAILDEAKKTSDEFYNEIIRLKEEAQNELEK